jgi:hypothetical protein
LNAPAGTISTANPKTTVLGRAEFTLVAPTSPATVELSALEVPAPTAEVIFGATSTGQAGNISIEERQQQIAVAGVGQTATMSFKMRVTGDSGTLAIICESAP